MESKIAEQRHDCDAFTAKQFDSDCGDCQTDGHYLCANCKRIADFDSMELSDNRVRYYEAQETAALLIEMIEDFLKPTHNV